MLYRKLREIEAAGKPIKVGVVGAGKFGTDVITQLFQMKGMRVCAVADVKPDNALRAYKINGVQRNEVIVADSASTANDAMRRGKYAFCEDGVLLAQTDVDVVFEITGVPESGALVAFHAITNKKHIVMVNVEADVTVGPILKRMAEAAGVVYTCCYGDQPGVIMELFNWVDSLGFEVVAAGRGTQRFPFDRDGTPDDTFDRYNFSSEWVDGRQLNPYMYTSFRDGTKSQIEMTCVANMTGLVPDVRGMHEPSAAIPDLPNLFALKQDGGVLSRKGVVELANCVAEDGKTILPRHIAIGVFVVFTTDVERIREEFRNWLPTGAEGKNAVLYRDYHCCGVEAPLTAAQAAIFREPIGAPIGAPVAEVITVAKRNLNEGEVLDGSGGYTVYGLIEHAEVACAENLLPLGLAYGVPVNRPVAKGEPITYEMVRLNEDSFIVKLRWLQDAYQW